MISGEGEPSMDVRPTSRDIGKGLTMSVEDVVYSVKLKGKNAGTKTILNNVNAVAKPGRLLAIMGPSGSGKTSMLNIMAGKVSKTSGELKFNNVSVQRPRIQKVSAYVEQDDNLLSTLTVRESLHLAARLQLPNTFSKSQKIDTAEEIIDSLHLRKAAATRVGDPAEGTVGVSGGERKRVSVGVSLVRNPHLLFLDEPTSGLDSSTAYIIIKTLKDLARKENRTIVVTIHQPSSDVFNLFDDLLLLLQGNVVYHGEVNNALTYFAGIGFQCPEYSNPADYYFMHVMTPVKIEDEDTDSVASSSAEDLEAGPADATVRQSETVEASDRIEMLANAWKNSAQLKSAQGAEHERGVSHVATKQDKVELSKFDNSMAVGQFEQFKLLTARAWKQNVRNKMRARARLGQALAFAVIIAVIYAPLENTREGLQDRSGALFFVTANLFMSGTMSILTTFANERATFIREYQGGMYSVLSYYTSKLMVEAPFFIMTAIIYMTIIYWSLGFQAIAYNYVMFLVLAVALQLSANGMGILAASLFSRIEIAIALLPLLILPMMLFSGFVINTESIPVYLAWLQYISPIKYAFVGMATIEFTGWDVECPANDPTCPKTSDQFLENFNFEEWLTVELCVVILLGLGLLMTLLGYVFLLRLGNSKRKAS